MPEDIITREDTEYYKKGEIPPNNTTRFYFDVDINDDEHAFLFKKVGQNNIRNLFLLAYRLVQTGRELTLEEWNKELNCNREGPEIIIRDNDYTKFKKIIKKIKEHIKSDIGLQNKLEELLVKQFIEKHNIKSLLEEAVGSYEEDFNISDLIDADKSARAVFLRSFKRDVLKRFQPSFTNGEKQELFIQLDFLLSQILSERDELDDVR